MSICNELLVRQGSEPELKSVFGGGWNGEVLIDLNGAKFHDVGDAGGSLPVGSEEYFDSVVVGLRGDALGVEFN